MELLEQVCFWCRELLDGAPPSVFIFGMLVVNLLFSSSSNKNSANLLQSVQKKYMPN